MFSQGWQMSALSISIYGFDADACDEANAELDTR